MTTSISEFASRWQAENVSKGPPLMATDPETKTLVAKLERDAESAGISLPALSAELGEISLFIITAREIANAL